VRARACVCDEENFNGAMRTIKDAANKKKGTLP
jgi:hypothetical protein